MKMVRLLAALPLLIAASPNDPLETAAALCNDHQQEVIFWSRDHIENPWTGIYKDCPTIGRAYDAAVLHQNEKTDAEAKRERLAHDGPIIRRAMESLGK